MSEIQVMQAIHDALREEMLRDEKVFIIGEDIGIYGGCFGVTRGLKEEFDLTPDENTPIGQWPEPPIKDRRLIEPPIVEGGFTGIAVGAAMYGYRPVVEYMFPTLSPVRWTTSSIRRQSKDSCSAASAKCLWSSASPAAAERVRRHSILSLLRLGCAMCPA